MRLENLENMDFNVILIQTGSVKLLTFIKDRVKRKYAINSDSTIEVKTNKDLKLVREVSGVMPPFSDKWFVDCEYNSNITQKEFDKVLVNGATCLFFIEVSNYRDYKTLRDTMKTLKIEGVGDFYINYLRRIDMVYLYDAFVPQKSRMTKALFDYVVQGYSGDIDAVFSLFLEMASGKEITTRKQIADICGMGGLTVESFIFMLLKPPSMTEKGLKKVLKNRIQAGRELGQVYTWGTLYNYMYYGIYRMIELKTLLITGVVYKSVKNLPSGYDEKKLARYQKYIYKLKEIPLSRLLRLIDCMGDKWRFDIDYLEFIYKYFTHSYTDVKLTREDVHTVGKSY